MEENRKSRNPLKRLDDLVLKAANGTVRAWNWTTGRTKSDLANGLLWGGGTLMSVIYPPVLIPLVVPYCYVLSKDYKINDSKEIIAAKDGLKDIYVEQSKKNYAFSGYSITGICTLNLLNSLHQEDIYQKYLLLTGTLGYFIFSSSFQIMRADSLPPRKNVVERGVDKLADWYKEYKAEKSLIPAYVRV